MNRLLKSIRRMVKIGILTLLGAQSMTPAMASMKDEYFARLTPLSEAVLDSMRGGFQRGPDGPFMSFGIERNVFINEKLINSMTFNIPDLKQLTDQRDMRPSVDHSGMKPFADHPNETFTLIQSGPGNSFHPDLSTLPPFMTVIQNSLDNRTIQSHTVINATVEALTLARSLDLGNALSQANMEAIRH
ncbi:MAG TPA: hypothetical protein VN647_07090 [Nitrospira sp.]|nr:hypothetical protein [Nitrospira sp.]